MPKKIVILEDNVERRETMQRYLEDRFYQFDRVFFDAPTDMTGYLADHWGELAVIGLDHDLELKVSSNGRAIDPGTGREVAEFLAQREPVCPVVIHTTNSVAAAAMQTLLRQAKWKTCRVVPYDDLAWIPAWFRAVRRAIVGPISKSKQPRTV